MSVQGPIPTDATWPVDVRKAGALAAHMWRIGDEVTFVYDAAYLKTGGPPVAFTLPLDVEPTVNDRLRVPPFFEGLLPEGSTRRGQLRAAFKLAEDDDLGLLHHIGADAIGDVQVLPHGTESDDAPRPTARQWSEESFDELWQPESVTALPGVQPKMSARSRSLRAAAHAGPVILKFALPEWTAPLHNEAFFMAAAARAGLDAPRAEVVTDRTGRQALEVARFDRSLVDGAIVRHAQEDATQVLGLRPGEKYDPDAATVIAALAEVCAAPIVAVRDLFRQLAYRYAIGDNDVHAKNVSVGQDSRTGLWSVTPLYDVLHTFPYEGDHSFVPRLDDAGSGDQLARRRWLDLASRVGLPERVATRILDDVADAVTDIAADVDGEVAIPQAMRRDMRRRLRRRAALLAE